MKRILCVFLLMVAMQAHGSEFFSTYKYHVVGFALLAVKTYTENSYYLNHQFPNLDKVIRTGPTVSAQMAMLGLSMTMSHEGMKENVQYAKELLADKDGMLFCLLGLSAIECLSIDHGHDTEYDNVDLKKYEDLLKSLALHIALYTIPPVVLKKIFS